MGTDDGDILGVAVIHDNDVSGEVVNRYQFQVSTPGPVSDATVLDDVKEIIEILYLILEAWLSVRNVLREVTVTNETKSILIGSTDAGTYVGGIAGNPAAAQGVAAYLYYKTSIPRVILSKYVPPITAVAFNAEGRMLSGLQTTMASYGASLMTPFIIAGVTYQYGYLSPKVLSFVVPQVLVTPAIFGYQRRRKEGRGS